jgi:hypothetical protein
MTGMTDLPEAALIAEIDEFCERAGVSRTTLGLKAINDPALYSTIKAGRELRRMTRQRVRDFMADYQIPSATEESAPAGSGD